MRSRTRTACVSTSDLDDAVACRRRSSCERFCVGGPSIAPPVVVEFPFLPPGFGLLLLLAAASALAALSFLRLSSRALSAAAVLLVVPFPALLLNCSTVESPGVLAPCMYL